MRVASYSGERGQHAFNAGHNSLTIMEGLMGAAKDAMGGGGEAPPHDPAEAEARVRVDSIIPDSRPTL